MPDKWKGLEFNGLSVTLVLAGVNKLNIHGDRVGFICSPIINKVGDEVVVTINDGDKFNLSCAAEIIIIDSVEPYLDQRWK